MRPNPTEYILLQSEHAGGAIIARGSNLEWCESQTREAAQKSGETHTLYKLVPVYRIEVKVTQTLEEFREVDFASPGHG